MLTYAIGDVHGHLGKLQDLHKQIIHDASGRDYEIIHIGDLCDRGPNSRGVYEYIIQGQKDGQPWLCVKGNHDRYITNYVNQKSIIDADRGTLLEWTNPRLGGDTTLQSFGVDLDQDIFAQTDKIAPEIVTWIENLPLMILRPRIVYVHAGIFHKNPLDAQREVHCLWIRDGFLGYEKPFERLVIHGHTIVDQVTHFGNRLDIDTGAGKGHALSAIVIDGDDIFEIKDQGRVPVNAPQGWTLWGQKTI